MSYAAETGEFNSFEWTGLFPNQTVSLNYGPHELDAVVHGRPLHEPASVASDGHWYRGVAYLLGARTLPVV
jgi:hypothetical protein